MLNCAQFIKSRYPSLNDKWFRWYVGCQIISLSGVWMQSVSLPWIAYRLTDSVAVVGLLGAVQAIPVTVMSIFAGALIDASSKRSIVLSSQCALALISLTLAAAAWLGLLSIPVLFVCAALVGMANAVDQAARTTMISELFDKDTVVGAAAIGFVVFNFTRIIGPLAAGFAILRLGYDWAFFFNAVSSLPIIFLLWRLKGTAHLGRKSTLNVRSLFASMIEGVNYSRKHPGIGLLLVRVAVFGILGFNFSVLLPPLIKNIFHSGEGSYGLMISALGFGSLCAALIAASRKTTAFDDRIIIGSPLVTAVLLCSLAYAQTLWMGLVLMAGIGFANILFFSVSNGLIQVRADPMFRGRVNSLYVLCFGGMTPIGNSLAGAFAAHFSSRDAFLMNGIVIFVLSIAISFFQFHRASRISFKSERSN